MKHGRGPEEDSQVIHQIEMTACYGTCIQFWDPEGDDGKGCKTVAYVTTLSDVMDKTGDAAVAHEDFILAFSQCLRVSSC